MKCELCKEEPQVVNLHTYQVDGDYVNSDFYRTCLGCLLSNLSNKKEIKYWMEVIEG